MNEAIYGNSIRWRNVTGNAPVISFQWLCEMMQSRQRVVLLDSANEPVTGVIGEIQAEDGSGKCWNVTVSGRRVFVRTV
jgi:hypothetical protein